MENKNDCTVNKKKYNRTSSRKCAICGIRKLPKSNVLFAHFPLSPDRCRLWVKASGIEDLVHLPIEKLRELKYVCGSHFAPECFNSQRNRLLSSAVPTLNLKRPLLSDALFTEFPLHVKSYYEKIEKKSGESSEPSQAEINLAVERIPKQAPNLTDDQVIVTYLVNNPSEIDDSKPIPSTSKTPKKTLKRKRGNQVIVTVNNPSVIDDSIPIPPTSKTPKKTLKRKGAERTALTKREIRIMKCLQQAKITIKSMAKSLLDFDKLDSDLLTSNSVNNQKNGKRKKLTMQPIIIVHGGAGDIPNSRVQGKIDGTLLAVKAGYFHLRKKGGSALDAVEAAVRAMELDENFNAGYGSVLNISGEVEMEASIMSGTNLDVGAVTLLKEFLHPISIARKVLSDSPHSLLGGDGAKSFALHNGFSAVLPRDLISPHAMEAHRNFLKHGEFGRTEIGTSDDVGGGVGTVGAVAVDAQGHVAVATSTGGMNGKVVGRIGDTPQIGSGTYADDNIGGVSTTGYGEAILKYCLAHAIVKKMESGVDAQMATEECVNGMTKRLNKTAGAITLSKTGEVGVHFSSQRMSWAYVKNGQIFYGIDQGQVLSQKFKK